MNIKDVGFRIYNKEKHHFEYDVAIFIKKQLSSDLYVLGISKLNNFYTITSNKIIIEEYCKKLDKNNIKIYEGDLVLITIPGWMPLLGYVNWNTNILSWSIFNKNGEFLTDLCSIDKDNIEVVGNIHEKYKK